MIRKSIAFITLLGLLFAGCQDITVVEDEEEGRILVEEIGEDQPPLTEALNRGELAYNQEIIENTIALPDSVLTIYYTEWTEEGDNPTPSSFNRPYWVDVRFEDGKWKGSNLSVTF